MGSARARVGHSIAAVVILLGLAYPFVGDRVVQSLVPNATGCPDAREVPTGDNEASTKRATPCLLNRRRAEHGLGTLAVSPVLERAAERHSRVMARRQYFAHDAPGGVTPARRMVAVGYPRHDVTLGENLAWGEESAASLAEIVEGWMESPGHWANVLGRDYKEIGIGLAYEAPPPVTGRAAIYTTDFGRPPAAR